MSDSKHLLAGERVESLSFPLIENQTPSEMADCKNVWDVTQEQMRGLKLPTAEEIQHIREMAHKEGYAAGEKAGLAAGKKRIDQEVQRINGVLNQLAQPLAAQPEKTSAQLTDMLNQMLQAILHRELLLDSAGVQEIVQEALAAIDHGAVRVQVRLNPQDLAYWQAQAQAEDNNAPPPLDERVTLVADKKVKAGGCLVQTDACQVDGTVETRLNQVLESLYLGLAQGGGSGT